MKNKINSESEKVLCHLDNMYIVELGTVIITLIAYIMYDIGIDNINAIGIVSIVFGWVLTFIVSEINIKLVMRKISKEKDKINVSSVKE